MVKGYGAGSLRALLGSMALLVLSALQLIFLANIESVLGPLIARGAVSFQDSANTKFAIALWNVLVPLVAGGVGVNLFTAWLTHTTDAHAAGVKAVSDVAEPD